MTHEVFLPKVNYNEAAVFAFTDNGIQGTRVDVVVGAFAVTIFSDIADVTPPDPS